MQNAATLLHSHIGWHFKKPTLCTLFFTATPSMATASQKSLLHIDYLRKRNDAQKQNGQYLKAFVHTLKDDDFITPLCNVRQYELHHHMQAFALLCKKIHRSPISASYKINKVQPAPPLHTQSGYPQCKKHLPLLYNSIPSKLRFAVKAP
jgi:hypothetical protein